MVKIQLGVLIGQPLTFIYLVIWWLWLRAALNTGRLDKVVTANYCYWLTVCQCFLLPTVNYGRIWRNWEERIRKQRTENPTKNGRRAVSEEKLEPDSGGWNSKHVKLLIELLADDHHIFLCLCQWCTHRRTHTLFLNYSSSLACTGRKTCSVATTEWKGVEKL